MAKSKLKQTLDSIADLKEQRAQAILADLPESWGDTTIEDQERKMRDAEASKSVRDIDEQIRDLRQQQRELEDQKD